MGPPIRTLKRKRVNQPEEIAFDFSARQEYLTGFHKRKVERTKHAQDIAVKKEKELKLESRRQLRAERKEELQKYVKSVDELMHKAEESWQGGYDSDVSQEWEGIEEPIPIDHEANYSDDDRNTTVVVEEVDVTRDGFRKLKDDQEDEPFMHPDRKIEEAPKDDIKKKRKWTPNAPIKEKTKKKKFRYETKAERKVTRSKERSGGAKAKAARRGK